ncbi:MAG: tRNA (guanosine(46)-N7)-methyltransferase TrmB [Synechococcales bacterium]|nr:tRNA (guanosine(46)-N7)-methyltransferase TrmB [Synechococcales bacterium]
MPLVRVREHVNPLARKYQTPASVPAWSEIYADFSRPLHLDIGCARGKFAYEMALQLPEWNFLGLEIREPLVIQANEDCSAAGLTNLYYFYCNASNTLRPLLQSLPPGILQRVTIQFPDPWFKRKHRKRRVVQPELVQDLVDFMPPGATLFIQSDVLDIAQEMRDRFSDEPQFQIQHAAWLANNPLPVQTERESATLRDNSPVYRALFVKV